MNQPMRTEAIKNFLIAKTHKDLAGLYNPNMEVQVNVAQDGGERVESTFQGRQWHGWTDGFQTWKSFRIPYKANSVPEYQDKPMNFDLAAHAEGIGMTGWNWQNRCSRWVAFDFDAIVGHSDRHGKKLSDIDLKTVQQKVTDIPWVTIRYSTSGSGLHLYVFLDNVPTANHNEHAALARSIIGVLSAITSYDLKSKVDICGGNMWVWHRKMQGTCGLELIKQGGILTDLPANWKDHVKVVTGTRNKVLPAFAAESDDVETMFEELSSQRTKIPLDDDHRKLIDYLQSNGFVWWWDADHHMLVTHTFALKKAHQALGLRGIYDTMSQGTELHEQNCFCAPLRRGAWSVRRFTPGVQEANTWTTDASGWTQCYFNQAPDLRSAARAFGGVEDTDGAYVFREAEVANQASSLLGATLELPNWLMSGRQTKLKQHKDGRIIVEIKHEPSDITTPEMANWLIKKGTWQRIYNIKNSDVGEPETGNYDDIVRHLVTESGEDAGWVIKNEGSWISEPYVHVKIFLQGLGIVQKETTQILGSCINKCWRLVNRPFQDEYIGDRQWNRSAAQLRYAPSDPTGRLHYPTWLLILNHVGQSLDNIIKQNPWAKMNHVLTGADYLKCWLSSMFKEPTEPLPYLFLYGPQASGKSIFHEAIELLVTSGVVRADAALINQSGFNAEIENGVLCVVEETDMQKNKVAYNRIKDFVTSRKVSIHRKGQTPYSITNTSHWIHCSNELNACPVFPGDSRITMLYVPELKNHIPKKELIPRLEKEAPDFLSVLLNLEIPYSHDRLNIPVIETEDKKSAQEANRTLLEEWLDDHCFYSPGHWVKYADLYAAFKEWTDPNYHFEWSMVRFGKELPKHKFPKGRNPKDAQWYIGNISLEAAEDTGKIYKLEGDKLILKDK